MKKNSEGSTWTLILNLVLILILFLTSCTSLPESKTYEMKNAPFPHEMRKDGHTYKDKHYSFEEHYSDSSVLVIIPESYKKKHSVDLMIFFHGWGNSKDTCDQKFDLAKQVEESKRNMLLVIPEGPKFAPDSFNGKLCDEGGFQRFIDELLGLLKDDKIIRNKDIGRIIISGHSGGYYTMAYILRWGGYTDKISDVINFDGLYWLEEDYLKWLMEYDGRLVNIYTENGGTKDNTEMFMEMCDSVGIDYYVGETKGLDAMPEDRVLMLYSDLGHSDVMHKRKNLLKILNSLK
jgi:hypothetical protein